MKTRFGCSDVEVNELWRDHVGEEQSMNCMRNHFSECNKDRKSSRDVLVVVAFFSLCFFIFADRLP